MLLPVAVRTAKGGLPGVWKVYIPEEERGPYMLMLEGLQQ